MAFFIAAGLLVIASTAYLLHEFRSQTLEDGAAELAQDDVESPEPVGKAA